MMAQSEEDPKSLATTFVHGALGQTAGIAIMICVAANDAVTSVMARTMQQVHFSVIMFWFSAIGLLLISVVMVFISLKHATLPTILTYTWPQH